MVEEMETVYLSLILTSLDFFLPSSPRNITISGTTSQTRQQTNQLVQIQLSRTKPLIHFASLSPLSRPARSSVRCVHPSIQLVGFYPGNRIFITHPPTSIHSMLIFKLMVFSLTQLIASCQHTSLSLMFKITE